MLRIPGNLRIASALPRNSAEFISGTTGQHSRFRVRADLEHAEQQPAGPGFINADLGVDRKFQLTERFELSFRTDIFNVANTPHHVMPGGNGSVNSSNFLQATGIANTGREGIDQRSVRFALRLGW